MNSDGIFIILAARRKASVWCVCVCVCACACACACARSRARARVCVCVCESVSWNPIVYALKHPRYRAALADYLPRRVADCLHLTSE